MKRSELPDDVFGIPQERKYPMPDKRHTLSAIKLFNHVDDKYEEELAKAIIKNIKKYNISDDEIHMTKENRFSKYYDKPLREDATGNAIVGSNMPESIYIVNYMQNNAFSGHKERKLAICRNDMKDLHTIDNGYAEIQSLEDFEEIAEDVEVYRYKGVPVEDFKTIIEYAQIDYDFYSMLTGRNLPDKRELAFDNEFVKESSLLDEFALLQDRVIQEASQVIDEHLYELPILSEQVDGRPWNWYTDINGVFIKNEVTGVRSASYEDKEDINESVLEYIKRGF